MAAYKITRIYRVICQYMYGQIDIFYVLAPECEDILFKVLAELNKADEDDGLQTIVRTLPYMI